MIRKLRRQGAQWRSHCLKPVSSWQPKYCFMPTAYCARRLCRSRNGGGGRRRRGVQQGQQAPSRMVPMLFPDAIGVLSLFHTHYTARRWAGCLLSMASVHDSGDSKPTSRLPPRPEMNPVVRSSPICSSFLSAIRPRAVRHRCICWPNLNLSTAALGQAKMAKSAFQERGQRVGSFRAFHCHRMRARLPHLAPTVAP